MAKKMLAILAALCLVAAMGAVGASAALPTNNYAGGEFHILVIPDAHQTAEVDFNLIAYIEAAIKYMTVEQQSPLDLVIFLGDNVTGSGAASVTEITKAVNALLAPVLAAQIPYTLVFGNHDYGDIPDIVKAGLSREQLLNIWKAAGEYTVEVEGESGPEQETRSYFAEPDDEYASATGGVTNFYYQITKNDTLYAQLFLFDIGSKKIGDEGYDYVREDQLEWFKGINDENADVPTLVFQHIPLPEVYTKGYFYKSPCNWALPGTKNIMGTNYFGLANFDNMIGTVLEAPCPPNHSDGEFEYLTEQGNVQAVLFGHDHVNNYVAKFPSKNIHLVQLPGAAWNGSYGTYLVRGGSFVTIRNNANSTYYASEFFTYRQASRVEGSVVRQTVSTGFRDWILTIPFLLQNIFR